MKGLHVLAVAGLVACGGPAAKPDYPSLDAEPLERPAELPIPPAQRPEIAEFMAPASNPSGGPVVINWRPAAVGDRRTRDIKHLALYSSTWDDGGRNQRTVRHFRIDEQITAVDDDHHPTALTAAVEEGVETVDLNGPGAPETLVSGEYEVTMRADGKSVSVSRGGSGFPIGDREREEIEGIYGAELGRDGPLLLVLKGHPLRLFETVELSDEEMKTAGGGDVTEPVHMTLASLIDGVATYQVRFWTDESTGKFGGDGTNQRGVVLTFGIEVATGRLRTTGIIDAAADSSPQMKSSSRLTEDTVFTY